MSSAFTSDLMRESRSFTGRRVPAAVTDVTSAVLAGAACLAPPKAIPPGARPLRSPDHWWLVLVLLSGPPLVVDRVEAADRIGLMRCGHDKTRESCRAAVTTASILLRT